MQSDNRRYIPLLDVLRAGAALWVVLYHVVIHLVPAGEASRTLVGADNPVTIVLSQGWLAVSLFVMLSGYSLSLGLTKGEIIWGAYLKARWLRVAPLYLVILMIGLLATPLSRRPSIDSFLAAMTMLPVPDAFLPRPWLSTAWSVKVELVLYLFIPVLVYAARRYKPLTTVAMCGALGLVLFLALHPTTSVVDILYWGIPGRLVEFTVGFALGYAGRAIAVRLRKPAIGVGVAGFLVMTFVANRAGGFSGMSGTTRIALYIATIALAGLLLAAIDQRPKASASRVVAGVSAVGSWSYSTYLWHMIVIKLLMVPLLPALTRTFGVSGGLAVAMSITVAVVMVLSWASFNMIERPFLSLRPKYVRDVAEKTGPVAALVAAEERPTARTPVHHTAGPLARALNETGMRMRPAVPVAREAQLERTNESVGAGGRS